MLIYIISQWIVMIDWLVNRGNKEFHYLYVIIWYTVKCQMVSSRSITGISSPSHASWRCYQMSDSAAIFRQACRVEVNDRIWNQVLVNRLTTTSIKITKISWWEMLINYRWNWMSWMSWQTSRLTFICQHVQFEWLRLLYPATKAGIPSKFSSIN